VQFTKNRSRTHAVVDQAIGTSILLVEALIASILDEHDEQVHRVLEANAPPNKAKTKQKESQQPPFLFLFSLYTSVYVVQNDKTTSQKTSTEHWGQRRSRVIQSTQWQWSTSGSSHSRIQDSCDLTRENLLQTHRKLEISEITERGEFQTTLRHSPCSSVDTLQNSSITSNRRDYNSLPRHIIWNINPLTIRKLCYYSRVRRPINGLIATSEWHRHTEWWTPTSVGMIPHTKLLDDLRDPKAVSVSRRSVQLEKDCCCVVDFDEWSRIRSRILRWI